MSRASQVGISVEARREPLGGLWKDLGVSITEKDIAEARGEMWGSVLHRTVPPLSQQAPELFARLMEARKQMGLKRS